jgi:hypothetical protein
VIEIHYAAPGGGPAEELVERAPLDFQKTRW